MSGAKIRLALAAICFVGWLGWLGYLSYNYSRTVIVSRSQMMFATHAIRATLTVDEGVATGIDLREIIGKSPADDRKPAAGEKFDSSDLKLVLLPFQKPLNASGTYLIPVRQVEGGFRMVAPPGSIDRTGDGGRFLIYPDRESVVSQIRDLLPDAN